MNSTLARVFKIRIGTQLHA